MTALEEQLELAAAKFREQLEVIENGFVGRHEAVQLLGLGALSREHVLLLGPPGTAKTRVVERFCHMLETKPFSYLLTRFTEPSEIFGPIDVDAFTKKSRYQVNTEGMLPQARIAFLDEVFQGSSAILNTLLTLINDRTFRDGRPDSDGKTPLVSVIGSSNEIPNDPALSAFSDRFLLRCRVRYVGLDQIDSVLTLGWTDEQGQMRAAAGDTGWAERTRVSVTPAELSMLQQAVVRVDIRPVISTYLEILRNVRGAAIKFSDRRAVKAQKVFAASALLGGRLVADVTDLKWLANLWTDEADEETLRKIVAEAGVPVETAGDRVRDVQEILEYHLATIQTRTGQVSSEAEFRQLSREARLLASELRRDHPEEVDALQRVQTVNSEIITTLRERYPYSGGDYV